MQFHPAYVLEEADLLVCTNNPMVRTKQFARLSTGGKAPRKKIATKAERILRDSEAEAASKIHPQTKDLLGRSHITKFNYISSKEPELVVFPPWIPQMTRFHACEFSALLGNHVMAQLPPSLPGRVRSRLL